MGSKLTREQSTEALSWIAYVRTYYPEEFSHLKKTGNPSAKLILIDSLGTPNGHRFPVSLSTRAGVSALVRLLDYSENFSRHIPEMCYLTLNVLSEIANTRRLAASRDITLKVGEAILGWAAANFTTTVIFSFRMIREWMFEAYSKDYSNKEIKRTLEWLSEQPESPIAVKTYGEQNNYGVSTKIEVKLGYAITNLRDTAEEFSPLTFSQQLKDDTSTWVDQVAPANTTVWTAIRLVQECPDNGFRDRWRNTEQKGSQGKQATYDGKLTEMLKKADADPQGKPAHECKFRSYITLHEFRHCCSGESYSFGNEPWSKKRFVEPVTGDTEQITLKDDFSLSPLFAKVSQNA